MTPEAQKLEGTLAHQIADAIWYCTRQICDLYKPTPPLSLAQIISGVRDFNVAFRRKPVAKVTPDNVEAALHQLEAAGEATCDAEGRWTFVPKNKSIFCDEKMSRGVVDPHNCINRNITSTDDILSVSDIHGDDNATIVAWIHALRDLQFCCDCDMYSFDPEDNNPSGMTQEQFKRFWKEVDARRRAAFITLIELELDTLRGDFTIEDLKEIVRARRPSQ